MSRKARFFICRPAKVSSFWDEKNEGLELMGQGKKGDNGKDGDSKRMRRKKAKKDDKKVELADINKAKVQVVALAVVGPSKMDPLTVSIVGHNLTCQCPVII